MISQTHYPAHFRKLARAAAIVFCLVIGACASTPPPVDLLADAEAAVAQAQASEAPARAPLELRFANEKLASARLAMNQGDYGQAQRLAEQAVITSELARAKAAAAAAREASRNQRNENRELRENLGLETGGVGQ